MLKNIVKAGSECITIYEKKASYYIDYIDDLTEFFGDDSKEIRKQTEKRNVFIYGKYRTD